MRKSDDKRNRSKTGYADFKLNRNPISGEISFIVDGIFYFIKSDTARRFFKNMILTATVYVDRERSPPGS